MMTRTGKALLAVVLAVLLLIPGAANSDAPAQFGRFREIRHEEYTGPSGDRMTEYLMYDMSTMLVYIYTTDKKSMIAITPYMMRDYFGQITCGLYNKETGGIDPAEMSTLVEEDEWDVFDARAEVRGGGSE